MERKFYEKYNALKKRKLVDEALERKREAELKELYDAMKDWVSGLEKDKEELSEKLVDKEDELEKAREDFLADIRARDSEILRLKRLLNEKTEKNNSTATQSVEQTPEVIQEIRMSPRRNNSTATRSTLEVIQKNPTRMSPRRKTPQTNSKAKRVQMSENTTISHSSREEESQEQECPRRHACISGNETNECPSAHLFHSLLQSLVRMKVTVHDGTEGSSVSVSHEASGYSFTLTWLEKSGEWSYKLSSLGTLERIATNWMKQDIRFSMNMCRAFFERISNVITG